ncbi:TrkA family potassium uptake protein [Candidatus Nomurabacteria bacterium]|nr:TrkA family potassium uptake protein [Candidatus Nomurabacteria bacterium]
MIAYGHEVVIVENDKELMKNAADLDCMKINGVPIDKDILKSAGIEGADALCAATPEDNMNLMTAQVAKEIFGVKKVVARIFNPSNKELFEEFGINTICSTTLSVNAMIRALSKEDDLTDDIVFGTDVVYSRIPLEPEHFGTEIIEISRKMQKHIAGFIRDGRFTVSLPTMRVQKGDVLVILSTHNRIRGNEK